MMRDGSRIRDLFDWPVFMCVVLMCGLGVINLYSATSVYTGARAVL